MAAKVTLLFDRLALDLIAASGLWTEIHLFKNNYTPTPTSVLADFVECDFSGYAAQLLVFSPAFVNATPKGQVNAASYTWVRGAGATSNTVYGMYVLDSTTGEVTAYHRFPSSFSMVTPGTDVIFYQFSPTAVSE